MNEAQIDLVNLYESIWQKIQKAVLLRNEPWHLVTIGTVRDQSPEIRTLVLRGADPLQKNIWMHTDLRSPKCQDIEKSPRGSVLFYDPIVRWQLRLSGVFHLDPQSALSDSAWKKTTLSARRCYQGPFSPGTLSSTLSTNMPPLDVSPNVGRENFCRLIFQVSKMDWLFLRAEGHQRAQWDLGDGTIRSSWVNP